MTFPSLSQIREGLMRRLFGTLTHVETEAPALSLTFDDGPHPKYTPKLLDVLRRHGARASFFMVGRYAQESPDLVQRAIEEGHDVGNHTWNHAALPQLPSRERRRQIRECEKALGAGTNRLFRPPFGAQSTASRVDTWRAGAKKVIGWSAVLDDWKPAGAETLSGRLREALEPGAIILLHDGVAAFEDERGLDRSPLIQAVDTVLGETREEIRFVPVTELLGYGRPHYVNWREQIPLETLNQMVHAAYQSSCPQTPAGE